MGGHPDGYDGNLSDEELAKQLTDDLHAREAELAHLDSENRKLIHKLNKAMG